jgi:hypothetical protein
MPALIAALGRARTRTRTIVAIAAAAALVGGAATTAFALRPWQSGPRPRKDRLGLPPISWRDERPGCNCPLSACDGACLSECKGPSFVVGDQLPGISVPDRQEALQGASTRGDAVLFLAGTSCSLDRVRLAHLVRGTYVDVDLTEQIDPARFDRCDGCFTLAPEGDSVILTTRGGHGFVQARLDGDRLEPPTPLLEASLPAKASLRYPVLSSDQRTLYFRILHPGDEPGLSGALDGMYLAERSAVGAPFERWQRLPGHGRKYGYVTGVSADGLSLFVADEYSTRVLVRASTDAIFNPPGNTLLPAKLYCWRAVPIDDCRRIITTISPGGCHAEDITFLEVGD